MATGNCDVTCVHAACKTINDLTSNTPSPEELDGAVVYGVASLLVWCAVIIDYSNSMMRHMCMQDDCQATYLPEQLDGGIVFGVAAAILCMGRHICHIQSSHFSNCDTYALNDITQHDF